MTEFVYGYIFGCSSAFMTVVAVLAAYFIGRRKH